MVVVAGVEVDLAAVESAMWVTMRLRK